MWRVHSIVGVLLALGMCGRAVATEVSTYPADVASQLWGGIKPFDEPPFWTENAGWNFDARYRLFISGIVCRSYVFRIDVVSNGTIRGTVKSRNRCSAQNPDDNIRRFKISSEQLSNLTGAFHRAQLWTIYPEFWVAKDENEICLDGEELVFERLTKEGYGISSANAQCTAPPAVLEAARIFIEVSREKQALHLLQ